MIQGPVRLRPGIEPAAARTALYQASLSTGNARSEAGATAGQHRRRYLEWVAQTTAVLQPFIRREDIERLFLTRRHWLLLEWSNTSASNQDPPLLATISTELDELKETLTQAVEALDKATLRWESWDYLLVPDTNVLLHHPDGLHDADWHGLAGLAPNERLLIVLPILIVDELDKAKTGKNETRARARAVTRAISDLLPSRRLIDCCATLREAQQGVEKIGLAVVLDPPGHVRLPGDDDEIADRAAAVAELAHGEVRVLTYDAGMALRSRVAGLKTELLTMPTNK